MQEVFTRAWRHAEAYDPTRGSVRTWLYQIARHAIIDTRRRAAVRPALALHEPRDEQDPEGSRSNGRCWDGRSHPRSRSSPRTPPGDPPRPRPRTVREGDRRAAGAARGHRQKPYVVRPALAAADLGGNGSAGMTHVHEDIGAYVLGALDERRATGGRAHRGCEECAPPHAELAGLPALLDLAVATGASDEEPLLPRSRNGCWIASRASASPSRRASAAGGRGSRSRSRARWPARPSPAPRLSLGWASSATPDGRRPVPVRDHADRARAQRERARRSADDAGGHGRAPVGQQPAGRAGDVYEVFCDAKGWSASAGTFRVDANGNGYVILTAAVKRGQYE